MRIAIIGHSNIALRQQWFWKELAKQGHDVLVIAPGEWRDLRCMNESLLFPGEKWSYTLVTCRHTGGEDVYMYQLLGAKRLVEDFHPDWLYVQAEAASIQAMEGLEIDVPKRALFTWQNIGPASEFQVSCLEKYDLVICGNPEAEAIVKPHNSSTALLLQVGIDTNHFQARPDVEREVKVGFIGRQVPEKGLPYLSRAYPGFKWPDWTPYLRLPWIYSQIDVMAQFSQDVPYWREQAPNYVCIEALSCGCKVVSSDTPAMAYWLQDCPAAVIAEGHLQTGIDADPARVMSLQRGINKAIEMPIGDEGRQWVVERFSSPVMAKKLVEVLSGN